MIIKPRVRVSSKGWTRPMAARMASYDAAGNGRRSVDNWGHTTGEGPVRSLAGGQNTIRRRLRHEIQNNGYASRPVDVLESSVVGEGLRPNLRNFNDDVIGPLFRDFSAQCDADEVGTFEDLQRLAFREVVSAGEVFARIRDRSPKLDGHLKIMMQVQILPSEMVPTATDEAIARSGIVFSDTGRRKGNLMHKVHPGDRTWQTGTNEASFVPVDKVLHVFRRQLAGQIRGEPWLVRGLMALKDLDAFMDAALVRQKLNSMVVWSFENSNPAPPLPIPVGEDEDGNPVDASGNIIEDEADPQDIIDSLEPGSQPVIPQGWTMKSSAPAELPGQFDSFTNQQMKRICAALNVPYELVIQSADGTERMARLDLREFHKLVKVWRKMLVRQFCRPVWEAFLRKSLAQGLWAPVAGKTLEDYIQVDWIGDPPSHSHPVQEVEATLKYIEGKLKSHSEAILERGADPETVFEQIAADKKRMRELGITDEDLLPTKNQTA